MNELEFYNLYKSDEIFISALTKPIRDAVLENKLDLTQNPLLIKEAILRIHLFLEELKLHKLSIKFQRSIYHSQLKNMTCDDLFAILDYTLHETRNEGKVATLTIAFVSRDKQIMYFDFFFKQNKEVDGAQILGIAWEYLFQYFRPKRRLYLWSDRGGKDFMNHKVMKMYQQLSYAYKLEIIYSTFESMDTVFVMDILELEK
jgi:hypothetical protein